MVPTECQHCLHIRGLSSRLTMVLAPEEQELRDYRLTQPDGVGRLEPAKETFQSHMGMGVREVSEWG